MIASQSSSVQVLKSLIKRNLSTQTWIYHKSLKSHKEVLRRAHKDFRMSIFVGETSNLQRRERKMFYTRPPKISHWKLASKNRNIRFLETVTFEI
jgi:hypothetical protein